MYYNRKSLKVITPASAVSEKPVSLAEMKSYMRVDTEDDDALINDFIDIATECVKQYTRRSIMTETLELTIDYFGDSRDEFDTLSEGVHNTTRASVFGYGNEIDLPFIPIQSITSIKTYDTTNAESTFSSTYYQLDETGGRVYLNSGATWPTGLRDREAIKIRYVAGYGSTPQSVPAPIKQAIRQHVSFMYECRQSCELPPSCKALLEPYRLLDHMGMG